MTAQDPISFQPQSTDRLPGDVSPDTSRVLLRGRSAITTVAQGGGVNYSLGSKTIDLSQYDFSATVPEVSVYVEGTAQDGSTLYIKCPYIEWSTTFVSSNLAASYAVNYNLQRGTAKGADYTLRLVIYVISKSPGVAVNVNWQVMSNPAAGTGFANV